MTYYPVDIPNSYNPDSGWVNMGYFDSRENAIEYCKKTFGADDKGRICLVSEVDTGEEDDA
jgi:hypothetical protein